MLKIYINSGTFNMGASVGSLIAIGFVGKIKN